MPELTIHEKTAIDLGSSPWTLKEKLLLLIWAMTWKLLCSWTPKPLFLWRLFWFRVFGGVAHGKPFIHQSAKVTIPWKLTLHDKSCLGDRVVIYSLDQIEIGEATIVAQEAYLCTGTHDLTHPHRPLLTGKIRIGKRAFVGARAFVMPGITIGDHAVVGACTVVTKDVDRDSVVVGNPAKFLKKNEM
jgi:putative colanic acid biosynthesis acetyltransferase WcaF